jgi:predicted Zn-dependent protease
MPFCFRTFVRFAAPVLLALASAFAQEKDKFADFQFSQIDLKLLDEANAMDDAYAKAGLVLKDPDLQAYLDTVGKRILNDRGRPEKVEFRFRIVRDPMVQAFALPNGSVYVTTGLMALLENEAQLAGVLGHETSHVFDRHSYFENRSARKKILTANIIGGILSVAGSAVGGASGGFGSTAQIATMISDAIVTSSIYGYSREMEQQADSDGLKAMTNATYDPLAMARSFQLLDDDSRLEFEPIQGFYRDHPRLTERYTFATAYATAHKGDPAETGSEADYLAKAAPAICADIEEDLNSRRQRTAVARATRLVAAYPANARYRVLLADSYRGLGAKTAVPTEDERNKHGQAEHRKEYFKMTEQEEQKRLLAKPGGPATLLDNRQRAEGFYKAVLESDPSYAPAHRGLGFLYEDEEKYPEAAAEYQAYLNMVSGTSLDHLRIERRVAAVQKKQALVTAP